jgi:archaellum component FlaF (FlaF/FlaG flagellin family)
MPARRLLGAALVVAVVLGTAAAAYAGFTSATAATQAVSSATLQPPTNVVATRTSQCNRNKAQQVTVTWTGSASTFATGYTIQRNGTTVTTLAATATSYVDDAVAHSTAYTYAVVATYRQWTAGATAAPVTTC